jgi:hypothetical protein
VASPKLCQRHATIEVFPRDELLEARIADISPRPGGLHFLLEALHPSAITKPLILRCIVDCHAPIVHKTPDDLEAYTDPCRPTLIAAHPGGYLPGSGR